MKNVKKLIALSLVMVMSMALFGCMRDESTIVVDEQNNLTITESKRRNNPDGTFTYDKHKIFLYKEDFEHFSEGLDDVIAFVKGQVGEIESRREWTPEDANAGQPAEQPQEEPEEKKRGLFDRLMGKD